VKRRNVLLTTAGTGKLSDAVLTVLDRKLFAQVEPFEITHPHVLNPRALVSVIPLYL
jgi:hypothetical protein